MKEKVSVVTSHRVQLRAVHVTRESDPFDRVNLSAEVERRWFEVDRSVVLHQIDVTLRALEESAQVLEMVAAEGVFERPLSRKLSHISRMLKAIARALRLLRTSAQRASRYPVSTSRLAVLGTRSGERAEQPR